MPIKRLGSFGTHGRFELMAFPLYHGSSSHYLRSFQPGRVPAVWPHKAAALSLLREACAVLCAHGAKLEWHVEKALNQVSGHSNWQHGELYVTPSKLSAVRYAGVNAACGGELLTICNEAVAEVQKIDSSAAVRMVTAATSVAHFLSSPGTPILVEFQQVSEGLLSSEASNRNVSEDLARLASYDDDMRELVGQQLNFRLSSADAIVSSVYDLAIEDPTDPFPSFSAREIHSSSLWLGN